MDCLVSCNCSGRRCLFADECDCQEPSELRDDSDEKIFAYTKQVRMTLCGRSSSS